MLALSNPLRPRRPGGGERRGQMTDIMDRIGVDDPAAPGAGAGVSAGAADDDDESIYRERRDLNGYAQVPVRLFLLCRGRPALGDGKRPVAFYQYASLHGPIPLFRAQAADDHAGPQCARERPGTSKTRNRTRPRSTGRARAQHHHARRRSGFRLRKGNAVRTPTRREDRARSPPEPSAS